MPKLTNTTANDTCFLCGSQAFFISINSKQKRCVDKITQCPGHAKKAQMTRNLNTTTEERAAHMKHMSQQGNKSLSKLHTNPDWVKNKSKHISVAIAERGGHKGSNNPMFNKLQTEDAKMKQSLKARNRDPNCYKRATNTKILKGIAVPKESKSEWELYREKVTNETLSSWKLYYSKINPNNLVRGKEFELDHKFSITEGFLQKVPPEVIGHYHNLELIPKDKNRSKRTRCSITLIELMDLYSKR